jgi:hypothetical protein
VAGFSLLETVLSVGLLSIVVLGAIAAFGSVAKVSASDPMRDAAEREMRRIVTLESAVAKYSDPSAVAVATAPWSTSMPFAGGTPIPITVNASTTAASGVPAMTVTIRYAQAAAPASISKTFAIVRKAPAPESALAAPGSYADPNTTPTP